MHHIHFLAAQRKDVAFGHCDRNGILWDMVVAAARHIYHHHGQVAP
jgi:hypothetical protein